MCGHDFPDFDYLKDIFMTEIKTESSGFPNFSLRTIASGLAVVNQPPAGFTNTYAAP